MGKGYLRYSFLPLTRKNNTMDTITLMEFESGEMDVVQIVEMLSEMLEIGCIDNYDKKFKRLANMYIRKGILDDEGNINYIKLNEEV